MIIICKQQPNIVINLFMINQLAKFCIRLATKQTCQFRPATIQSRFYFSGGYGSLDALKAKLDTLYDSLYKEEDLNKKYQFMKDVIQTKLQLNNAVTKSNDAIYPGRRRDLLVLAQLHLQLDEKHEAIALLSEIMQGDFLNEFDQHPEENKAYLSELFILHCISNLHDLRVAEESGNQALSHLQYFVEKHCPIYNASSNGQKASESLELEPELQYLQNLLQHLQLVAKICQERGKLEASSQHLGYKATLLDNLGHLLRKVLSKEAQFKRQMNDEQLKKFFLQIMIQQAITLKNLAKTCVQMKRFEDANQLIETALQFFTFLIESRVIDKQDDNYNATLIENYNVIAETSNDKSKLQQIQQQIESNLKNSNSTPMFMTESELAHQRQSGESDSAPNIYSLLDFELFKIKHLGGDLTRLTELVLMLQDDVPSLLEYNKARITYLSKQGQASSALDVCNEQIKLLDKYFNPGHCLYFETAVIAIELSVDLKNFEAAKQYLKLLKENEKILAPLSDLEQRIKVHELYLEAQSKIESRQEATQEIQKLESMALTNFSSAYEKAWLLYKIYLKRNQKDLAKQKLMECQNILSTQSGGLTQKAELQKLISKL